MSAQENGGGIPGELSKSEEANVSLWLQILDSEATVLLEEDEE
jgi:hypothetical protein